MRPNFLLALALSVVMLFGLFPFTPLADQAGAARAKKTVRKVRAKKARAKVLVKTKKTVKKAPAKSSAPAVAQPRRSSGYVLPVSGIVSQKYSLAEGVDETGAETIAQDLRSLGVDEANVSVSENLVLVKFDPQKLTSIGIIAKLKSLGYTVKRID